MEAPITVPPETEEEFSLRKAILKTTLGRTSARELESAPIRIEEYPGEGFLIRVLLAEIDTRLAGFDMDQLEHPIGLHATLSTKGTIRNVDTLHRFEKEMRPFFDAEKRPQTYLAAVTCVRSVIDLVKRNLGRADDLER